MRVTTSKSKNSESFYITKSYTNAQGKSTSTTIKKLGTLAELSKRLSTDWDGVMAWARKKEHHPGAAPGVCYRNCGRFPGCLEKSSFRYYPGNAGSRDGRPSWI